MLERSIAELGHALAIAIGTARENSNPTPGVAAEIYQQQAAPVAGAIKRRLLESGGSELLKEVEAFEAARKRWIALEQYYLTLSTTDARARGEDLHELMDGAIRRFERCARRYASSERELKALFAFLAHVHDVGWRWRRVPIALPVPRDAISESPLENFLLAMDAEMEDFWRSLAQREDALRV